MTKFKIDIHYHIAYAKKFEVEANSEQEAIALAYEMAEADEMIGWDEQFVSREAIVE